MRELCAQWFFFVGFIFENAMRKQYSIEFTRIPKVKNNNNSRINGVQCKTFSAIGFILGIEKIAICAVRAGLRYTYSKYPHISFTIYFLLKYNGRVCVQLLFLCEEEKENHCIEIPSRKLYRTHNFNKAIIGQMHHRSLQLLFFLPFIQLQNQMKKKKTKRI